ncbi:hypothetical protein IEQ34_004711 [Dendrobium chrysotoxum]|uniref:Uncharacterized protein n=1 Tax=Dendrobium chrysotoxum TaxID=161865 RepID=A0AAV7HHE7_DENCH|nr:hypothetical protein IEQ34_004711 [Dendrobium chrysotoxum]
MALSTVCPVSCRSSLQPLQFLRFPSIGTSSSPLFHSHLDSKSFFLCPLSVCTHHHPILAYSGSNDSIETERLKSCLLDDDLLRRIVVKKDAHQAIEMIAEAKTNVSGGTVENDDCRLIIEAALVEKNVELALSVFYAMLSGRAQGMNEVTNLDRWGWARPNVQTYALLVRGLAACLRVADALGIIGLVSGAGVASGDEVPFGMIVQCPICMLAIAVAQPQHGVQVILSKISSEPDLVLKQVSGTKRSRHNRATNRADRRSKTEYMECNFSNNRPSEGIVTLADQVINKSTRFRYLGSIVQSDGDIDGDIISRIQVGWLKWRNASGLLCDRKVPLKLKGKFYKMVVRPAMLYGAECWPLKEKHNSKLSVAEMRMLRWMSGFTLRDRIRNEHIREKVGVAPVEDKIRESRLRWFGHVKRRPPDDPVASCSKCRYQYELVSGDILSIASEVTSMDASAWEKALRLLRVKRDSNPAAIHSIVVRTPSGIASTNKFATKTVELPAQEGERVTLVLAAPANIYQEIGPLKLSAKPPELRPGEPMSLTNHTTGQVSQLLRASFSENSFLSNPSILFTSLAVLASGDAASGFIDPSLPRLISVVAIASLAVGTAVNRVILPQLSKLPKRIVDIVNLKQLLLSQYDLLKSRIKDLRQEAEKEVWMLARMCQLENKIIAVGEPSYRARRARVKKVCESLEKSISARIELIDSYAKIASMIEIEVEMDSDVLAAEAISNARWRIQAEANDEVEKLLNAPQPSAEQL